MALSRTTFADLRWSAMSGESNTGVPLGALAGDLSDAGLIRLLNSARSGPAAAGPVSWRRSSRDGQAVREGRRRRAGLPATGRFGCTAGLAGGHHTCSGGQAGGTPRESDSRSRFWPLSTDYGNARWWRRQGAGSRRSRSGTALVWARATLEELFTGISRLPFEGPDGSAAGICRSGCEWVRRSAAPAMPPRRPFDRPVPGFSLPGCCVRSTTRR